MSFACRSFAVGQTGSDAATVPVSLPVSGGAKHWPGAASLPGRAWQARSIYVVMPQPYNTTNEIYYR